MKPFSLPIIRALIADALPENATVRIKEPGGDVDTAGFVIELPGTDDRILLCAFRSDGECYDGNRGEETPVDADMIELRDTRSDSSGGIQTRNEDLAVLAARIKVRLLQDGWGVTGTMDNYF